MNENKAISELLYHVQQVKKLDEKVQYFSLLVKEMKDNLLKLRELYQNDVPDFFIRQKALQIESNYNYTLSDHLDVVNSSFEKSKEDFNNVLFWAKLGKRYSVFEDTAKE